MYYDESRHLWKLIIVLGILGTLIGVPCSVLGLNEIFQAGDSRNWPVTTATIIHSEVKSTETRPTNSSSSKREYSYKADVKYKYYVEGKPLIGYNIRFGGVTNLEIAKQLVKKYAIGKEVDVYYDPSDHKNSVLEPGYSVGMLFMPLMGLGAVAILSFVAFVIWYFGIRDDKDKEPVKSPYNF